MIGSPRFSRILAAAGLLAAPVLFLVAFALEPAWSDEGGAYLADVARHETRHALWAGLFALGSLSLLAGLLGTARLLRGPRGTVGQIGAVVVGVAGAVIGGIVLAISVAELAMVDPAADRAEMAALYDRTEEVTFGVVVFGIVWFGGFILGTVTLAVGLLLRRIVPVWSPLLLGAWLASMMLLDDRLGTIVGSLLLLGAFAPIARRIATLTDEEWARWQPLPAPGRQSTRGAQLESGLAA